VRERRARREVVGTRTPIPVEVRLSARWSFPTPSTTSSPWPALPTAPAIRTAKASTIAHFGANPQLRHSRPKMFPIAAPISPRTRILGWGTKDQGVDGSTLQPASRCRTAISNPSTAACDLDQARRMIGTWVEDYNAARPPSSLSYTTPALYEDLTAAPRAGRTPLMR
jgi:transposase InsO family protein